ncbi:MAG TPA: glycosyltransferase family 25 protein [Candidatus Paceibacterota bacterium]|nr:glycosyltransferase family 25 protein [Candidatus Paceibacterota bacterium]
MRTYVINLDRHQQRMARITAMLDGLGFERVAAVDGRELDGPETDHPPYPPVSKYNVACVLSHRVVWKTFLKTNDRFACVLEDDIVLSADFKKFAREDSWIPQGVDLLKIETYLQKVSLSRQNTVCLDRSATPLRSRHFGTAGYIISRQGAEALLPVTEAIDRPADHILFGKRPLNEKLARHQLFPALCTQSRHLQNGPEMPELQSAIVQNRASREPFLRKMQVEMFRPFRQAKKGFETLATGRCFREHTCVVPFE